MEKIKLLYDLLNIPSVNGRDDEGTAARFLSSYLGERGLETYVQEIDEKHSNVIAVLPGRTDDVILWNGHLDTVPYGDTGAWKTKPGTAEEKDGKIYARGASDMKSGLAAMAYVLGALGGQGYRPEKTILFLGTCDEERGGLGASYFMEHAENLEPELILIGEPTDCRLGVAQKGCIWLKLHVEGTASHGAEPEQGANALEGGFRVLNELKAYVQKHTHGVLGAATMQITEASGGTAPNMTADRAEFTADIRLVPPMKKEALMDEMRDICETYSALSKNPIRFQYEILNDRMPVEVSGENRWIQYFQKLGEKRFGYTGIHYFTDASVLCRRWKDVPVILFGPGEPSMCHKANEYVAVCRYMEAIDTLMKFCQNME